MNKTGEENFHSIFLSGFVDTLFSDNLFKVFLSGESSLVQILTILPKSAKKSANKGIWGFVFFLQSPYPEEIFLIFQHIFQPLIAELRGKI